MKYQHKPANVCERLDLYFTFYAVCFIIEKINGNLAEKNVSLFWPLLLNLWI